ncbi:hypothetical protein IWQ61_007562 [Dispira simplex]|nr:hypothetical protein IWQ61_007562 [Dispira simplex]
MPSSPKKEQVDSSTDSQENSASNPKALYIGNLDPSVNEYAIIKLFAPFGEITRIDYKFHLHGPKRGQPRGFCFVEYATTEAAERAMKAMHGQRLKQRFLVVSASSVIVVAKSQQLARASTQTKIQALEAKLAEMQKGKVTNPKP